MGLFSKKKTERRIPDLSRYESHYENQSRSNSLSGDAAAAALRTYSLSSNSRYSPNQYYQGTGNNSRTNSLRNNSMRTHSLRTHSLTNNYRGLSSMRSNSFESGVNPNPIIIHTTKTEDEFGRTKSITTETIQQFGSFEIVKKKVTDLNLNQPPRPPFAKTGSRLLAPAFPSYAETVVSNELGSIREEEEEEDGSESTAPYDTETDHFASFSGNGIHDYQPPPKRSPTQKKPVKSILKSSSTTSSPMINKNNDDNDDDDDDDDDDDSVYSDALDIMPSERDVRFTKMPVGAFQPRSARSSITSSTKRPTMPQQQQRKKKLTEAEMYAKAMEVAKERVYGGSSNPSITSTTTRPTNFKSYSLRNQTPGVSVPSVSQPQQQQQQQQQQPPTIDHSLPLDSTKDPLVLTDPGSDHETVPKKNSRKSLSPFKKFFQMFKDSPKRGKVAN